MELPHLLFYGTEVNYNDSYRPAKDKELKCIFELRVNESDEFCDNVRSVIDMDSHLIVKLNNYLYSNGDDLGKWYNVDYWKSLVKTIDTLVLKNADRYGRVIKRITYKGATLIDASEDVYDYNNAEQLKTTILLFTFDSKNIETCEPSTVL